MEEVVFYISSAAVLGSFIEKSARHIMHMERMRIDMIMVIAAARFFMVSSPFLFAVDIMSIARRGGFVKFFG